MPEKTISIRLNENELVMLNKLIKSYSDVNKGLKITSSTIIRLSLIHEYERQQNNR